jgi:hypothetical protein
MDKKMHVQMMALARAAPFSPWRFFAAIALSVDQRETASNDEEDEDTHPVGEVELEKCLIIADASTG